MAVLTMNRSDIYFAVMEMHDSIMSASKLADHLEGYIHSLENPSYSRILYEMNRIDDQLHQARSKNAKLRKEINDAKRKVSEQQEP